MSRHERRYQKYLERKRQKHGNNASELRATGPQVAAAAGSPIYEVLVPAGQFEQGIGNLLFSRSLLDGRIAMGAFLLDTYGLGVKNAFVAITSKNEYALRRSNWHEGENLQPIEPACFRKLVEGGVAYARDLGFSPHADYALRARSSAMCRSRIARPGSSTDAMASPFMFLVPTRPRLRCRLFSNSLSGAWAEGTLTSSC